MNPIPLPLPIIISVDKDRVKAGDPEPIEVRRGCDGDPRCYAEVQLSGPASTVYAGAETGRPPLADGTRVWIETYHAVTVTQADGGGGVIVPRRGGEGGKQQ